ncbi:hypothetical protein FKM82_003575 [Ascaphus truei]
MESHHKGFLLYKNHTVFFNDSVFSPALLSDHKMLYFWFSDHVLNSLAMAAFLDGRLALTLTGEELEGIFQKDHTASNQEILREIFQGSSLNDSLTNVWSLTPPGIRVRPDGTLVTASVAVQLNTFSGAEGSAGTLYFEAEVTATIQASYADKKLVLHLSDSQVYTKALKSSLQISPNEETMRHFLHETVSAVGIPAVIKRVEPALTSLMNSKGLNLFEITNPEIIPQEGYLIIQLDFGFPHHLLVDFLKRSL